MNGKAPYKFTSLELVDKNGKTIYAATTLRELAELCGKSYHRLRMMSVKGGVTVDMDYGALTLVKGESHW